MIEKKEKNIRITKSTIETARKIFGSSEKTFRGPKETFKTSEPLAVIFLLTKKKMNVREIMKITGGSAASIFGYLTDLDEALIIEGERQALKTKRLDEMCFKINENLRSELVLIINSFIRIQYLLKKYKKEKEKKKI